MDVEFLGLNGHWVNYYLMGLTQHLPVCSNANHRRRPQIKKCERKKSRAGDGGCGGKLLCINSQVGA